MKLYVVLAALSMLPAACGRSGGSVKPLDRTSEQPVLLNITDTLKTGARLEDVLTSAAFIPLQTPESETMNRVDKVLYHNGRFICMDKKFSSLLVFDSTGGFVKKIGRLGSGANAYLSIEDIFLDPSGASLTVFSNTSRTLTRYSLQKDEVSTSPLPFNGWHCVPLGNDRLAFYLNFLGILNNHHNLFITDGKGNILREDLRYPPAIQSSFEMSGSLTASGEGYLVAPPFADTIYYGTAETLRPAYALGLGKLGVPPEVLADMQAFMSSGGQYAYAASRMLDMPEMLCFDYASSMTEKYALYHKKRQRVYTADNMQRTLMGQLFSAPVGTMGAGKLVTVLYPAAFKYYEKVTPGFGAQLQQQYPLLHRLAADTAASKRPVLAIFSVNS